MNVERGGLLIIEEEGKVISSLVNNGRVVLRGIFGGAHNGFGEFENEGGIIKHPVIKNGMTYYE
ncbi:hypothetical protein D1872_343510 [compost metagenome]